MHGRYWTRSTIIGACVALVAACSPDDHRAEGQGSAQGPTRDGLGVVDAWARPTMTPGQAGAVYLTVHNGLGRAVKLAGVSTPMAAHAALHGTTVEDGVVSMTALREAIVQPGASLILAPGGTHIMLMGLQAPLGVGDVFPLILTFEKAGEIQTEVTVRPLDAWAPKP